MNRLFINGDDFGLHNDINKGILDCVDAGIVRSISVSVNGEAPEWKSLLDLQDKGVRIGLHVTLIGEPWLTGLPVIADRSRFLMKMFTVGFIDKAREEIFRQHKLLSSRGIKPVHIDGHQHIHMLPSIWRICEELAEKYGVPRIRIPYSPDWRLIKRSVGGVALQALSHQKFLKRENALPCIGLAHSGRNTLKTIEKELHISSGSDVELVMHPGITTPELSSKYRSWGYGWSGERAALLDKDFRSMISHCGYNLAD